MFTRDGPGFTTSNNTPKIDQAEIDAMQALSPVIFVKKNSGSVGYYEKRPCKKHKQSVPESEKLSAHFSKLSG